MPPLSLIKCLKISLQATFEFFCATSVVQIIILLIQIEYDDNLGLFVLFYFL